MGIISNKGQSFWLGKRVLITGHTGFKGSWLSIFLRMLGAEVYGFALPPVSKHNLFDAAQVDKFVKGKMIDIRDIEAVVQFCGQVKPDVVFHLAAQPLVRASYDNPLETFNINVLGTVNLLDALRNQDTMKSFICITTDKVYENNDQNVSFKETDNLGGSDPYSASKACSELVVNSYRNSFYKNLYVSLSTVRAGNVIGGGDWSKDRLIPDFVKAWQTDSEFVIRNPNSIRPWQHVLEPLNAYVELAEKTWGKSALEGSYNIGPDSRDEISVQKVIELGCSDLDGWNRISFQTSFDQKKEAETLRLNSEKAKQLFGYMPLFNVATAIQLTINWYREYYSGTDALSLCENDIENFSTLKGKLRND